MISVDKLTTVCPWQNSDRHLSFRMLTFTHLFPADNSVLLSDATLIVCPASLVHQWAKEIERRCQRRLLKVVIYHGPNREHDVLKSVSQCLSSLFFIRFFLSTSLFSPIFPILLPFFSTSLFFSHILPYSPFVFVSLCFPILLTSSPLSFLRFFLSASLFSHFLPYFPIFFPILLLPSTSSFYIVLNLPSSIII